MRLQCEGTERAAAGRVWLRLLWRRHGAFDCGSVAGNYDLAWGVEVDGFNDFALCSFGTNSFHLFVFQTQNSGHCAYALRYGRLHEFGAQTD